MIFTHTNFKNKESKLFMETSLLLKAKTSAKQLRWIANQIPDDLGDEPEEKMLKTIKYYCTNASAILEELSNEFVLCYSVVSFNSIPSSL